MTRLYPICAHHRRDLEVKLRNQVCFYPLKPAAEGDYLVRCQAVLECDRVATDQFKLKNEEAK